MPTVSLKMSTLSTVVFFDSPIVVGRVLLYSFLFQCNWIIFIFGYQLNVASLLLGVMLWNSVIYFYYQNFNVMKLSDIIFFQSKTNFSLRNSWWASRASWKKNQVWKMNLELIKKVLRRNLEKLRMSYNSLDWKLLHSPGNWNS